MLAARAVEEGALFGRPSPQPEWEEAVRERAAEQGRPLTSSETRAAATAAHLTYAAAIGAVYGLIRSRVSLSTGAEGALLSTLSYVIDFPRWSVVVRRRERSPLEQTLRRVLLPAGAQGVYGYTTAAVFRALAR